MTVYLHQVHSLTGRAAVAPLLAAVEHDHLPLLERLDVRQVGYWETTAVQGRTNEVVAIWELDDYRHLQRLARAMHGGDADGRDLRAWREREAECCLLYTSPSPRDS